MVGEESMILALLISTLPLVFWWRFGNTRLDRDFAPYAYPGVFRTGYLKDGHRDIKPPLIHWSYQLWLGCISMFRLKANTPKILRLLPMLTLSFVCFLVGLKFGPLISVVLALLLCSPYLWTHMANTEWLTVALIAFALSVTNATQGQMIYPFLLLGLLPLINQKNVLLIVPVAWALGLNLTPIIQNALAIAAPSMAFGLWLLITKRMSMARLWLWDIPKNMGKKRKIRTHIVGFLHLYIPFIYKFVLVLAIVDYKSPWFIVFLAVVAMSIASKAMVPHHFILWALPLALCANPTPLFFVGWVMLWFIQDWPIWKNPSLIYALTFRYRSGSSLRDYGQLLEDADEAVEWLKKNTDPDESIWVNGAENHIYIDANRKATAMSIIEAQGTEPRLDYPRVIVHSAATPEPYDYTPGGYEHVMISPHGFYTVLVRNTSILLGSR